MSEWISVEDRLPGYDAASLVWDENAKVWAARYSIQNECFVCYVGFNTLLLKDGITHWQPLPDPPTPI